MNRIKKELKYSFDNGPTLKGEKHQHRVKGKSGKTYRSDAIPKGVAHKAAGFGGDVHFGSHASIARQIGEEMRKRGL